MDIRAFYAARQLPLGSCEMNQCDGVIQSPFPLLKPSYTRRSGDKLWLGSITDWLRDVILCGHNLEAPSMTYVDISRKW